MIDNDYRFIAISWIPAPKCETCGTVMAPVSPDKWACSHEVCPEAGVSVKTDVIPMAKA